MEGQVLKRFQVVLIILALFSVFSCSQDGTGILDIDGEYSLESIEDGTVLEPGDQVNIVLSEVGDRARSVVVELMDSDGEVVAEITVDPDILKGLGMPLDLPSDLTNGLYSLHFEVFEDSLSLYEESRYFYVFNGILSIHSLNTYPPGILPGDEIRAQAGVDFPEGTDPWLRWTLDGTVLQEGPVSETGLSCLFTAPDEEGVYSLGVELFPVEPRSDQVSAVARRSDLFVSVSTGSTVSWQMVEDRNYRFFIDFSDSLSNRMYGSSSPAVSGNPAVKTRGSYKGYLFAETDGLIFDEQALPSVDDGSLGDFVMALVFSTSSLPEAGNFTLFSTGAADNRFQIRSLAGEKVLQAVFSGGEDSFALDLPFSTFTAEEVSYLELSYKVTGDVAVLKWISRGRILASAEGAAVKTPVEGKTFIGATPSSSGLPMNWYSFAVSSGGAEDASGAGILVSGSPETVQRQESFLYERGSSAVNEIRISGFDPGAGIGSIEIESDAPAGSGWNLEMTDRAGSLLYSVSLGLESAENDPGTVLVSYINDSRGFFVNSSLDTVMNGPFAYQENIAIRISPESDGTVQGIRSVRYYQD